MSVLVPGAAREASLRYPKCDAKFETFGAPFDKRAISSLTSIVIRLGD
jgi:hypothetical protein